MKSLNNNPNVIGLVGHAAAGKDRVAEILVNHGFSHCSLGNILREEISKRGLVTSRSLQSQVADELRAAEGGAVFMRRAAERICGSPKSVLSGLYSVSEGSYLIHEMQGTLISVVAHKDPQLDLKIRYERLTSRADGPRDNLSFEDFGVAYNREQSGLSQTETNVQLLMEMARYTILNSAGMADDDIYSQLETVIGEIG